MVLGLGALAFAGPLSGSWESELTIGFRDVVVTDPGASFTVPGGTYAVTQGTVTIPGQDIAIAVSGGTYTYVIPDKTVAVGPFSVNIPELTLDVENGTVTYPGYDGTINIDGYEYSFTVPASEGQAWAGAGLLDISGTFDIEACAIVLDEDLEGTITFAGATGDDKICDIAIPAGTYPITAPTVDWEYGDEMVAYTWAGEPAYSNQTGSGTIYVPAADGTLDAAFDCATMMFGPFPEDITLPAFQRILDVDAGGPLVEDVVINFPAVDVEVTCNDLFATIQVPARTGTGTASWGETFTVTLAPHNVTILLGNPTLTMGPFTVQVLYDGNLIEVVIPAKTFDISMPSGFPWCTEPGTLPAWPVTISWDDNTSMYGTCTCPGQEVTVVVDGQEVTFTIPEVDIDLDGGTVTLPARTIAIPADTIVVPGETVTINVDGEDITFTVPSQTVNVSNQTVTIPDRVITIPGWTQTITKVPTLGFTSTLIVDYTVGGWVFNSTSKFDDTGWIAQSFAATGTLGAFSLTSDLVFAPATAAFTSWDSTGSVSIAGVKFDGEFYLTGLGSGWTFGASGSAGDLTLAATVYFNMTSGGALVANEYCFCFSSVDFDISFPFTCIELVDISLGFSTSGFDGITFAVTGIEVPGISWITFDASLTFDDGVTGKSLTLTPNLNLGDFSCLTLYAELVDEAGQSCANVAEISGIKFYGIGLDYTWNGVSFSSQSSFDADYNEKITGLADYWELFKISSAADACCGGAFDFSVSTYFSCTSAMLFDWGESVVKVSMGLGSNYSGWTSLTVGDTGFTQWKIGFKVTW